MKNIFYWSPFISKVATIKAVINSAHSINKYSNKNLYKATIVDAGDRRFEVFQIK